MPLNSVCAIPPLLKSPETLLELTHSTPAIFLDWAPVPKLGLMRTPACVSFITFKAIIPRPLIPYAWEDSFCHPEYIGYTET